VISDDQKGCACTVVSSKKVAPLFPESFRNREDQLPYQESFTEA